MRQVPDVELDCDVRPIVGRVGGLDFLPIEKLVVDERYQRQVSSKGMRRIREIALNFSWLKFTPVVVAPCKGGKFAIIDGQHRTAAAKARGDISEVPCFVIDADAAQQAAAFVAINAENIGLRTTTMWRAQREAGEPLACAVFSVIENAGLSVPGDNERASVAQTASLKTVAELLPSCGAEKLTRALMLLRVASERREEAITTAAMIKAVAWFVVRYDDIADERVLPVLEAVNPNKLRHESKRDDDKYGTNVKRMAEILYQRVLNWGRGATAPIQVAAE